MSSQSMNFPKTVLVTGASKGIGRACVRTLMQSGWHVKAVARDSSGLKALKDSHAGDFDYLSADLCTIKGRALLFEWLSDSCPNCIVHCLGGNVEVTNPVNAFEAAMQLNFHSVITINEHLLSKSSTIKKIIHMSSSAAIHGRANTPYACAKVALNRYIADRGSSLVVRDVAMTGIMPPAVEGDDNNWAQEKSTNPENYERMLARQVLNRTQTTEEIATLITWLCNNESPIFSGCLISTDSTIF